MGLANTLRQLYPSNWPIWQKITLAFLVFTVPLIAGLLPILLQQNRDISFTQHELAGTEYLRPLRRLMEQVSLHQIAARQSLQGEAAGIDQVSRHAATVDGELKTLENLDRTIGASLSDENRQTSALLAALKLKWQDGAARVSGSTHAEIDSRHAAVLTQARELMALVGDKSNLIHDPQLDSYYVMDNLLHKQPEAQQHLAQVIALGEDAASRQSLSPDERTQLAVKVSQLQAVLDASTGSSGLKVAFLTDSTPGKGIRSALEPNLDAFTANVRSVLDAVRNNALGAKVTLKPGELSKDGAKALAASYQFWDASADMLDQLLEHRLSGFRRAQILALATAFTSALVAAFLTFLILHGFNRQLDSMSAVFDHLRQGNYTERATVFSGDDLGRMAEALNHTLDDVLALVQSREERDTIQASILKLLDEVSGVAEGDLTKEAEVTADMTGAIADSFNYMIDQLRKIIGSVQATTMQVTVSASEIHSSAETLVHGAQEQAEKIGKTSSAIERMAESIQRVSTNAGVSTEVAQTALARARNGSTAVQNTVAGMNRIRDQVQETAKRIKRLGESSQQIGQIVQLIDDIADRTSILALNASIQAAAAGDAGRGFAVVAEEVERLAVRSTDATKKIAGLVKTIQGETTEAVSAMEKGIQEVVEGSKLANQAGQSLVEIETVSQKLAELIQSISRSAEEQARGSEALAKSMGEISAITKQTADGTKQAVVSVTNLAGLADELRESVSAFRLPGSESMHDGLLMEPRRLPTNGKGKNGSRTRAMIKLR